MTISVKMSYVFVLMTFITIFNRTSGDDAVRDNLVDLSPYLNVLRNRLTSDDDVLRSIADVEVQGHSHRKR